MTSAYFQQKPAKIRRLYGKTDQNGKTCNFSKFHPILMIYPTNESSGIEFLSGYERIWKFLFSGFMEPRIWEVLSQQVPKWRHMLSNDRMTSVFHKNFRNCLSSQCLAYVSVLSNLHAPKWSNGAKVSRWLIWQVPEWRHLAFYDAMASDFEENNRDHFSYQYLPCVKFSSRLEHQKWTYRCFYFCMDYEICRNYVHLPKKHPR